MKFVQVEKVIKKEGDEQLDWKEIVLRPLVLGFAFGTGCYIAKVILNCPLMGGIMDMAE